MEKICGYVTELCDEPRAHYYYYYLSQRVFNESTDGVCQETCRDFGHMQMGMASAMNTAETAHVQGVDLWGEVISGTPCPESGRSC